MEGQVKRAGNRERERERERERAVERKSVWERKTRPDVALPTKANQVARCIAFAINGPRLPFIPEKLREMKS